MAQATHSALLQRTTSASLILVLLVSTAVGAMIGAFIGSSLPLTWLALVAGVLGVLAAIFVRNTVLNRAAGIGPDDYSVPGVVSVFTLIASIAGSLAAKEVLDQWAVSVSPELLGTIAGLFSAVLMVLLMVTYYANPQHVRR